MKQLKWLLLQERVKYRQSQLVFEAVIVLTPDYMRALFKSDPNLSTSATRSIAKWDLYAEKNEPMTSWTPLLLFE